MKLLQKVWNLAELEGQSKQMSAFAVFDPIGLLLSDIDRLDNFDYWCTPINSVTFARTGGDGVHFGLLYVDGQIVDHSPVVMTVPMMFDKPNVIVGRDLYEFLCFGSEIGYFVLEQIAYGFWGQSVSDWYTDHLKQIDGDEQKLLNLLKQEFDLRPWANVETRLKELQDQYLPSLKLKEDT